MSKLVKCKSCEKEIASGAKCPNCGKDNRNFFMKHKVLTVILALIIIGVIGAVGTSDTEEDLSANIENSIEEIKEVYTIGEEVKLNDNVLILNSIERSNGSEWDKPKDGNEYVIVTVTIKNGGTSEISYNPFDFQMQNSKGQITDQAFTTIDTNTSLNSGKLIAGGEITGTIVFEQPVGDEGLILKYKSNMFSDKEVKVKID